MTFETRLIPASMALCGMMPSGEASDTMRDEEYKDYDWKYLGYLNWQNPRYCNERKLETKQYATF